VAHRYTQEQIDFIREIATGRYNDEIAERFNGKYGTQLNKGHIRSTKKNYGITSNVPKRKPNEDDGLFTKEQKDFIKANVVGASNQKLTDLVNSTFGLSFTVQQVKTWKKNHNLSSGLKGTEGIAPPNKGTKGLHNVGGNKTSFKKGQRPNNYKPIGTERIDTDGYTLIKVSDAKEWHKRWRHKHKVMWEEANGPVPRGHAVLFADGDRQNITLDNLILVTKSQLARLNQNHLISENPELTKSGIIVVDIIGKIAERKRGS
jgi:hypothetical protein